MVVPGRGPRLGTGGDALANGDTMGSGKSLPRLYKFRGWSTYTSNPARSSCISVS
jgi:hypothetical protein